MDFTTYDDATLEAISIGVCTERARRYRMAQVPAQIQALAAAYIEDGGDMADLTLDTPGEWAAPVDDLPLPPPVLPGG